MRVLAAVRSPFAPADGVLAGWHPVDLTVEIASAALREAEIDPTAIDGLWVGCDEPVGAQGANLARAVVLAAGWPESTGAVTVEAAPHSGMSALAAAVDAIAAGRVEVAVVVGVQSASMVPPGASALSRTYGPPWGTRVAERYEADGGLVPPVLVADRAAAAAGVSPDEQLRWSEHSRAARMSPTGAIVTVDAKPGEAVAVQKGTPVDADGLAVEAGAESDPVFADGTTTAATFAAAADGVSVLILGPGDDGPAEITDVAFGASSPFDVAGPTRDLEIDLDNSDIVTVAAPCASAAVVGLRALNVDAAAVARLGASVGVGDAGAADDLRTVIDAIAGANTGEHGWGLRLGAGAASGCRWRRL